MSLSELNLREKEIKYGLTAHIRQRYWPLHTFALD